MRVDGAFDVARAQATLANGELTSSCRSIAERRGRAHQHPDHDSEPPAHEASSSSATSSAARAAIWCARACAALVEHHGVDLVIANGENCRRRLRHHARTSATTLLEWGVDVMTSGNHIWDKKEALDYIADEPRLLRPANYPAGTPGRGIVRRADAATAARSA